MNFKLQKAKNKLVVKNCEICVRKNTLIGILKMKSDSVCTDQFTGNHIRFNNDKDRLISKDFMFVGSKKSMEVNLDGYAIFPRELLTEDQKEIIEQYFNTK